MSNAFSKKIKQLRMRTGQTLREFCLTHYLDPGNYSRVERGLAIPKQETLDQYAEDLGLEFGTPDWVELYDLAAICRGELPRDMTEAEIVSKLPALFRVIREGQLDELIALIAEPTPCPTSPACKP